MSSLDRVTITGADDSVMPSSLVALSEKYPFVEWGILVSQSRCGSPRFPSADWVRRLQYVSSELDMSLHLCGQFVRALLIGKQMFPDDLLDGFDRVQLNFHAQKVEMDRVLFVEAIRHLDRQFIFQIDGANGNAHFERVLRERGEMLDVVPLFDVSGGAGILPDSWPAAGYFGESGPLYHGYAGGLGPDNLVDQLPAIAAAAQGRRHWVDMETRVRSDDDRLFALGKVETALRICEGFVSKPDVYSRRP